MKWCILGGVVLLFLPFYIFILSKSATLGRLQAIKYLGEILLPKYKQDSIKKEVVKNGKKE